MAIAEVQSRLDQFDTHIILERHGAKAKHRDPFALAFNHQHPLLLTTGAVIRNKYRSPDCECNPGEKLRRVRPRIARCAIRATGREQRALLKTAKAASGASSITLSKER